MGNQQQQQQQDADEGAVTKVTMGVLDNIHIGGVTELMITTLDAGFLTEPRNEFTFANYGISSSLSDHTPHPFTCALLAAHNTVGMYQNGRQIHGGSGGNGMITLDSSVGNEFSHEVGHNYGLGHYVGGFNGSVHRPGDEINSSWGWDSQTNVFTPNFASVNNGLDSCLPKEIDDRCQSAFDGRFQFGKDAMAGGFPAWGSNRYTMYTPNSAKKIQNFLEGKAVFDPLSLTGFSKYDSGTQQMKKFINDQNNQKVPRLYRVPVTTLVGYYDPNYSVRNLESYIYPAMHGAYGFVYNDDSTTTTADDSTAGCQLIVTTSNNGALVFNLYTFIDSEEMNKFHVNIATDDEPYEAKVNCQNKVLAIRALEGPNSAEPPLTYTVTGVPFPIDENNNDIPSEVPSERPSEGPSKGPSAGLSEGTPSDRPSSIPSWIPSALPSNSPSVHPSSLPIDEDCKDDNDKIKLTSQDQNMNCARIEKKGLCKDKVENEGDKTAADFCKSCGCGEDPCKDDNDRIKLTSQDQNWNCARIEKKGLCKDKVENEGDKTAADFCKSCGCGQ